MNRIKYILYSATLSCELQLSYTYFVSLFILKPTSQKDKREKKKKEKCRLWRIDQCFRLSFIYFTVVELVIFWWHWLQTMFQRSVPYNVDSVDINGTDFMVSPAFKQMNYTPSMACMDYSPLHCVLFKHMSLRYTIYIKHFAYYIFLSYKYNLCFTKMNLS